MKKINIVKMLLDDILVGNNIEKMIKFIYIYFGFSQDFSFENLINIVTKSGANEKIMIDFKDWLVSEFPMFSTHFPFDSNNGIVRMVSKPSHYGTTRISNIGIYGDPCLNYDRFKNLGKELSRIERMLKALEREKDLNLEKLDRATTLKRYLSYFKKNEYYRAEIDILNTLKARNLQLGSREISSMQDRVDAMLGEILERSLNEIEENWRKKEESMKKC